MRFIRQKYGKPGPVLLSGKTWFATTAVQVYGGLRANIEAWACAGRHDVLSIGVGTWKAALGCASGAHAGKDEVMQCVSLMGLRPAGEDEADACGVAFAAERGLVWRAKTGSPLRMAAKPRRAVVRKRA